MGKVIMSGIVPKLTKPIGLPTGYTILEYIQSSGTQYIDTEYKPKYNTRLVMTVSDFESGQWKKLYGCRETASATSPNQFCFGQIGTAGTLRVDYFGSNNSAIPSNISNKTVIDHNMNVVTAYGQTFTCTAVTSGEVSYTLKLFAYDNVGTVTDFGVFKLYDCKIYDNGTLIRDFIPCMSDTGVIGLYDLVEKKFYENKGSGDFTGDIIQPITGILASDIAVGSSVYLMENGEAAEYLVVNHGKPSSSVLYDSSCDGVWLMRKDLYGKRAWGYNEYNAYNSSTIHSYLNGTFLAVFDTDFQSAIKQVKLPYYNGSSVQYGNNGLSTKVFLPAMYELGLNLETDGSASTQFSVDGAKLSYFISGTGSSACARRKANYNGSADYWWSRSGNTAGVNTSVSYIMTDGTISNAGAAWESCGIRPTLVIPYNSVFDTETLQFKGVS